MDWSAASRKFLTAVIPMLITLLQMPSAQAKDYIIAGLTAVGAAIGVQGTTDAVRRSKAKGSKENL